MIAVGAISSYDDVNSLLLAGRADLCALGRTHLYDPQWTLHAAAEQDYTGPGARWPAPYAAGSRRPQSGRTDGPKPRLELIREIQAQYPQALAVSVLQGPRAVQGAASATDTTVALLQAPAEGLPADEVQRLRNWLQVHFGGQPVQVIVQPVAASAASAPSAPSASRAVPHGPRRGARKK